MKRFLSILLILAITLISVGFHKVYASSYAGITVSSSDVTFGFMEDGEYIFLTHNGNSVFPQMENPWDSVVEFSVTVSSDWLIVVSVNDEVHIHSGLTVDFVIDSTGQALGDWQVMINDSFSEGSISFNQVYADPEIMVGFYKIDNKQVIDGPNLLAATLLDPNNGLRYIEALGIDSLNDLLEFNIDALSYYTYGAINKSGDFEEDIIRDMQVIRSNYFDVIPDRIYILPGLDFAHNQNFEITYHSHQASGPGDDFIDYINFVSFNESSHGKYTPEGGSKTYIYTKDGLDPNVHGVSAAKMLSQAYDYMDTYPNHQIEAASNFYHFFIYNHLDELIAETSYIKISEVNASGFVEITTDDDIFMFDTQLGDWVLYYEQVKHAVITGQKNFYVSVDVDVSELEIRSYISAYDNVDGDITHRIAVESDAYSDMLLLENKQIGTYDIVYFVEDNAGNKEYLTVTVHVIDIMPPTHNAQLFHYISYKDFFDVSNYILFEIDVYDNYDPKSNLGFDILSDTYTENFDIPGTYYIEVSIYDSSENTVTFEMEIEVYDNIAPVITGDNEIFKSADATLTINEILAFYQAADEVDGNLTSEIFVLSNTYTANQNKVGIYEIVLAADDLSGNRALKTVTIHVYDDMPPVFYVRDFFFTLSESQALTFEDIIYWLYRTGQLEDVDLFGIEMISNNYSSHESTPGTYEVEFSDQDGGVYLVTLVVQPSNIIYTYKVFFETSGGNTFKPVDITGGNHLNQLADPYKEGYTFGGWYLDAQFKVPFNYQMTVESDLTLYAKWIEVNMSPTPIEHFENNWIAYGMTAVVGVGIVLIVFGKKKRKSFF